MHLVFIFVEIIKKYKNYIMLEKIEKQIKVYIYQVLEAKKIGKPIDNENPKLDFKRQWYDLKNPKEINEFLKDTTAIANTVGLDGYIVFGFDEKEGFFDSYFEDSKLRDTSDLNGIIAKRCSNLFDIVAYPIEIDGHQLSVLHIPPTLEKPILITNYQKFNKDGTLKPEGEQQRVFVRKGTSTMIANKYDLEMMFYDRKNIQPDYELELDIVRVKFFDTDSDGGRLIKNAFRFNINFNYENLGRKSISVQNLVLSIKTTSFSAESQFYRGGETWARGEVKGTGDYYFRFPYEDRNFLIEAAYRKDMELSLQIEMSNGKRLFKTFDFIPPYS